MSESEIKRFLIGALELGKTHQGGKPVAELFSTDTRLQYPVLRLFDLSALLTVGIDPADLQPGQRLHRRFFAFYTDSEKTNKDGNNYRDVEYLEPIDDASAGPAADLSALVAELQAQTAELRAIRALLQVLITDTAVPFTIPDPAGPPTEEDADDLDAFFSGESQPAPAPEPAPLTAEALPTSPAALLARLVSEDFAYTSPGHVLFGIRKASGSPTWAWPPDTDVADWAEALHLSREYARENNL